MTKVSIKDLGKLPYAGERKLVQVQGQSVCISRDKKLDRNGNPVYRASLVQSDGTFGKSFRTNGSPVGVIEQALGSTSKTSVSDFTEGQKKAFYSGMGYAVAKEGKFIEFKSDRNKDSFVAGMKKGKEKASKLSDRKGG